MEKIIVPSLSGVVRLSLAIILIIMMLAGTVETAMAANGQWTEYTPGTAPSARMGHTIANVNNRVFLFGGLDANGVLNDTWEWDKTNHTWQNKNSANPPPARYYHATAAQGGKMWIFGGVGENDVVLGDVWSYDPEANSWQQAPSTRAETYSLSRYNHTATPLPNNLIAIYGGYTTIGGNPADRNLWLYNTTGVWTQKAPLPYEPFGGHAAAHYDEAFLVHGGYLGDVMFDKLWKYTIASDTWEMMNPTGAVPSARAGHASAYYGNQWYIFGGINQSSSVLKDNRAFNFATGVWGSKTDIPTNLAFSSAAVYDDQGYNILLFGGLDSNFQKTGRTFVYKESTPAQYTLTVNIAGLGTVTKNPNQSSYADGTVVTLTATPDAGCIFLGWAGDLGGNNNPTTITMNSNKTVNAFFFGISTGSLPNGTVGSAYSQTLAAAGGTSPYTWSLDSGTMPPGLSLNASTGATTGTPTTAGTYNPVFKVTDNTSATATKSLPITINKGTPAFSNLSSPTILQGTPTTSLGGTLRLNTFIPSGNVSVTLNGVTQQAPINSSDGTFSYSFNTSGLTVSGSPYTINYNYAGDANYTPIGPVNGTLTVTSGGFTLTVTIIGQGTVTKDPDQDSYAPGTPVKLTAAPSAGGWGFSHWSGAANGSTNPTTITMDGNKAVTATFIEDGYELTTAVMGHGWITKSPDHAKYAPGTVVALTAHPSDGWEFEGWGDDLCKATTNPANITMNSSKFVTALFFRQEYTLTVNIVGQGTVTKDPNQNMYVDGACVMLTAIPASGWSFSKWSGNHGYPVEDIDEIQLPVSMSTNRTVTVTFIEGGYTPAVKTVGQGTVIKNPKQASYAPGTQVQFTAIPASGWGFGYWSGALVSNPYANPTYVTMTANAAITASFISSRGEQWQTLTPATSPPARSGHSITEVCNKLILFAGKNGVLNDTWEWERLERNWKKITPVNDPPPARHNHSTAVSECKLYIFFGVNVDNVVLNDVWSYDPRTEQWQTEAQNGTELPSGRYGHTTIAMPDGNITLFGGEKPDGPADNYLWKYNPSTKTWTKYAAMPGGARSGHSAGVYGGNLYAFGGKTASGLSNDLLKYTVQNNSWETVNVVGEKPPKRTNQGTAQWGNLLWIFGGEDEQGGVLSDAWEFDFITYTWKKLPDMPEKRTDTYVVAFASESIDILVFGGMDGNLQRTATTFLFEIKDKKEDCFIATASYGTQDNENLVPLRAFRDNILMKTPPGRVFVDAYYSSSPPIAAEVGKNEVLRQAVRWLLVTPASFLAKVFSGFLSFIILAVVLVALGLSGIRYRMTRKILLGLGAGTLTAMALTGLVFLGGSLANSVSWSAVVAAWLLPLILPLSLVTGFGVIIQHRKRAIAA